MFKFSSPKTYALAVGLILFSVGFFGFAFRSSFDLPDGYLFVGIILGFWGIVVGAGSAGGK